MRTTKDKDEAQNSSVERRSGWTDEEIERFAIRPSSRRGQPITDLDAFMASLPRFTEEEADALWQAIPENRAMRRAIAQERDDDIFPPDVENDDEDNE